MEAHSRRERKKIRKQALQEKNHLSLKSIKPITQTQELCFRDFSQGKNLLLHGLPGTGKSFISLYLSFQEIQQFGTYDKVCIIRSVVPSRDMGFLPGSIKEKSRVYEMPYQSICTELFGRGDAYEMMKNKNILDFQTSSFLRGITIDNAIVIVDECQNMAYHELSTIITRMGNNSRIIFCGDFRQTDLKFKDERQGIFDFMKILKSMQNYFTCVEFLEDDIVRSGLVKDFILKREIVEQNSMINHYEGLGRRPQNIPTLAKA